MVAVDSTTTGTMVGYHGPHYAIQSFHHSESSLAFSLNDSSDSFALSDFPVYDEATEPTHTAKSSPSRAVMRMEAEDAILKFEAEEDEPEIVREPEMEQRTTTTESSLFLEFSSSWPMTKNQSNKKAPAVAAAAKKSSKSNRSIPKRHSIGCKPKTATKVRFAPTLEVRTHSIVLGDHPWCEDGLAVELGWDYEVSRDIYQLQHTTKLRGPPRFRLLADHNSSDVNKKTKKVMHRSQQDRKRLLLEVGGCSETELDIRSFQAKILLDLEIRREEERRQEQRRKREKSRSRPHRQAPRESNNSVTNNDPNPCVGHTSSLYAAIA
jgi:hypothetical protein